MKNPGQIIMLDDGRRGIIYQKQPFLTYEQKMVIHLVDENFDQLKTKDGRNRMLVKNLHEFNELLKTCKVIGYTN